MAGDNDTKAFDEFKVLSEKEIEKLTPAEKTKYDDFLKEKERREQEELPYRWTQTLNDVEVSVPLPPGTKSKDLDIVIQKTRLKVGLKGQPPLMEGKMHADIKTEESTWHIDSNTVILSLVKLKDMEWWKNVLTHHPAIDTTKIQPENSKLSDLDGDVRAMVEKMMCDQNQKAQNKPTSDQLRNLELLKNFQAQVCLA